MAGPSCWPTGARCGWPGSRSRRRRIAERGGGALALAPPRPGAEPPSGAARAQFPPLPDRGLAVAEALAALVVGQEIVLKRAKSVTDRYGRLLAHAPVGRERA